MKQTQAGLHQVVKTVASPLRFFAVAAVSLTLIVVILAWKSALPPDITQNLIVIAFGALILLIVVVAYLVIFHPKKLVFDQEAHLTVLREGLGDNELSVTYYSGQLPLSTPNNQLLKHKGEK